MEEKTYSCQLGGKTLTATFSSLAEQANGKVMMRYGDTMILVTACLSKSQRPGIDFMPLSVDYEEKYYAAGRILGSRFMRRESRPSEEAILSGRLVDRTIRPRFNRRMRNDVQVVATILSNDDNDPDVIAITGASIALSTSNIPWSGPIAAVRVARIEGAIVINPTHTEREKADFDIVVSGTEDKINMLEAGANEVPEHEALEAIKKGLEEIKKIIHFQKEIIKEQSVAKSEISLAEESYEIPKDILQKIEHALYQKHKQTQHEGLSTVKEEWMTWAKENHGDEFSAQKAEHALEEATNDIVHKRILGKGERPDGRKPDELRGLFANPGVIPRVHGSGLFVRGQTQALTSLTLGGPGDSQIIEGMEVREKRHFMHHYNFPPFSTGEIKPMRGPGRREIGHGALAERALSPMLPKKEDFPYTIRLVSEILSSNGSSSMAATTASTIALMDGGVPMKKPVSGIAMGLMMDEKGENYTVLTDIQGPEDHHGDMDFKVAGTRDGVTAIQMDVKIEGVTLKILEDSFAQAKKARLEILSVVEKAIPAPRADLSPFAPRIITVRINPEKIGALIGPGGKNINAIIDQTGAQIDIEDDGSVFITSVDKEAGEKAVALVKASTREILAGEIFQGKVTRIFPFGAMVEIAPKQEGLVHISEISDQRVDSVIDAVRPGHTVTVKVKDIDAQGRINLTMRGVEQK
ncbi:MAG: polyribonucleotide nucleotidyltransferase [Patescibacteria group bacterium]